MQFDVTVIGGGPAGLMSAISAAEQGAKTLLIDKGNKLGKKLAISGGGRCNVTNRLPESEIIKHIPGNGKFLYSAFSIFNNYDIIDFFEEMGVKLKEEDHGRMFPASNKAQDVVEALINKLQQLNVTIRLNEPVAAINYGETNHEIILKSSDRIKSTAIVLAVGGKAVPHTGSTGDGYKWAKKAGHTITTLYPTEVPLKSNEKFIKEKELQGLSLRDASLSVLNQKNKKIITHRMDMIFTHFGISGPAVLRCSQYVVKEFLAGNDAVKVEIDTIPDKKENELYDLYLKHINDQPKKAIKNILKGIIPERYLHFLLEKNEIDIHTNAANLSLQAFRSFIHDLKHFSFYVHGNLPIEKAFVTGGGVSTKEIVPTSMQSKIMPRLYFCGEIIDIHGYTGGYNITAAMVTGRVSGMNAAWEALYK
ncbi:NAD(P)/FAD-dependent oxidoreductase [Saliterribacillus persicus]|uniref:Tricarballylate dehydrogenase n=1 Tax=Saliterribacillus persicus TaxID=930114 RepID=A0A368X4Q9_9BACI|nr:NAD(P)/FAD-dependent oxidoreductase [Saliterribacillus persicus]RCW62679.1 hypothetical protein DFR57_12434 [Saliterribacillus persicus]